MAKTEMPLSRTSEAATSSCVESGFEAHSTTSAPPSRRQMARFAVSAVTCRQAEIRMPFSGWFLINSLRIICSTFIDWLAQSIRFLPRSAASRFFTSQFICAVVVDILLLCRIMEVLMQSWRLISKTEELFANRLCNRFAQTRIRRELGGRVGGLPREVGTAAAEVPVGGGLTVDR